MKSHIPVLFLFACLFGLAACRPVEPRRLSEEDERPLIVATTTIVGDIVRRVAGDAIRLQVLVPPNADPHDYIFRPADMVAAAEAELVFVNGAGLEGHMDRLIRGVLRPERIVSLAQGIPVRHFEEPDAHAHGDDCVHDDIDPHFWTNPRNVMVWSHTIATALSRLSPEEGPAFDARAKELVEDLDTLDSWIEEQLAGIAPEHRLLVTDHHALGYFADRYGFEVAGVVIKSLDSVAQPSARDLAALIDSIRARQVPVIFVGSTVNPQLATQIARDAGVTLVPIYSGALSDAGGEAPDYFSYMRHTVSAIAKHLK